jgi:hypothetical protein
LSRPEFQPGIVVCLCIIREVAHNESPLPAPRQRIAWCILEEESSMKPGFRVRVRGKRT